MVDPDSRKGRSEEKPKSIRDGKRLLVFTRAIPARRSAWLMREVPEGKETRNGTVSGSSLSAPLEPIRQKCWGSKEETQGEVNEVYLKKLVPLPELVRVP